MAKRIEISLITTLTVAQVAVNGIQVVGQEEVKGEKFAGALRGWGCGLIERV